VKRSGAESSSPDPSFWPANTPSEARSWRLRSSWRIGSLSNVRRSATCGCDCPTACARLGGNCVKGGWFNSSDRAGPSRPRAGMRVTASAPDVLRLNFLDGLRFALWESGVARRKDHATSEMQDFTIEAHAWKSGAGGSKAGARRGQARAGSLIARIALVSGLLGIGRKIQ